MLVRNEIVVVKDAQLKDDAVGTDAEIQQRQESETLEAEIQLVRADAIETQGVDGERRVRTEHEDF